MRGATLTAITYSYAYYGRVCVQVFESGQSVSDESAEDDSIAIPLRAGCLLLSRSNTLCRRGDLANLGLARRLLSGDAKTDSGSDNTEQSVAFETVLGNPCTKSGFSTIARTRSTRDNGDFLLRLTMSGSEETEPSCLSRTTACCSIDDDEEE